MSTATIRYQVGKNTPLKFKSINDLIDYIFSKDEKCSSLEFEKLTTAELSNIRSSKGLADLTKKFGKALSAK